MFINDQIVIIIGLCIYNTVYKNLHYKSFLLPSFNTQKIKILLVIVTAISRAKL